MHGQQRDLDLVDTWILAIAVGLWVRLLPVFMTVVSDFWIRDADSHRPDLALWVCGLACLCCRDAQLSLGQRKDACHACMYDDDASKHQVLVLHDDAS